MMRLNIRAIRNLPGLVLQCGIGLLLGLGLILKSPIAVMIVLAGCFVTFAVVKRDETYEILLLAFLVLTSTIVKQYNPPVPIGIGTIYVADIILFGSFGWLFLRVLAKPGVEIIRTPLDFPLIMFCIVAMLSTFVSILQSTSTFKESLGPIRAVTNYLIFFLVTNTIREKRQMSKLWMGIFLLAVLTSVAMGAQYVVGESTQILSGRIEVLETEGVTFGGVTRIIPPGESLVFVAFVIITVLAALERVKLLAGIRLLEWGLLGLGLVLTFKRHFFLTLALFFVTLVYLIRAPDRFRILVLVSVFAVLTATLVLFTYNFSSKGGDLVNATFQRASSLVESRTYDDPKASLRWRDFEYGYAFPQIVSHPLIGLGLATIYRPFVAGRDYLPDGDFRNFIHNGHLAIIVKSGFIGYCFFVWLSVAFLFRGFKYWRCISDVKFQALVLGNALAYLCIMIGTIVSPDILNYDWTAVLGIMFGTNECVFRYFGLSQIER